MFMQANANKKDFLPSLSRGRGKNKKFTELEILLNPLSRRRKSGWGADGKADAARLFYTGLFSHKVGKFKARAKHTRVRKRRIFSASSRAQNFN